MHVFSSLLTIPDDWGVFQSHTHISPFSAAPTCSDFYKMECREYERILEGGQMQLFQLKVDFY
jgi:hypothetical protein